MIKPILASCLTLATGCFANASVIFSPVSVVSNSIQQAASAFGPVNLIDQSGLSSPFSSGETDFDSYLASNPVHNPVATNSFIAKTLTGDIVFDLGEEKEVELLAIWQGSIFLNQRLNSFSISTSSLPDSDFTTVGTFVAAQGGVPSNGPTEAQVFDLTDSTARFVRITVSSNYGHFANTGIGEIAFGLAAVPEPAAAVLAAMLAFSSAALHRRARAFA